MTSTKKLNIDVTEEFPLLKRSPLIEAVIYWQSHAKKKLEPEVLRTELIHRLSKYPQIQIQYDFRVQALENSDGSSEVSKRKEWNGFRLENSSKDHVVQFTPTGVVFSNLENYESWESFHQEALQLWEIFYDIAKPTTINRLGVRYLNKIQLEQGEKVSDYLKKLPDNGYNALNLPLTKKSFFYQENYEVPDYSYSVNWVCTEQSQGANRFLIVDIDVYKSELIDLEKSKLISHLNQIRWLKNKIFFNSITDLALNKFEG